MSGAGAGADQEAAVREPPAWGRRAMTVGWPAFLAACVLELLVFSVVDPLDVAMGAPAGGWSRQFVYTAAFFAFWLVGAASNLLTMLLCERVESVTGAPDN